MTAIRELNVIPVRQGSMSGEIAKAVEALEEFDITYEFTPMGTILKTDDGHELFAAARSSIRRRAGPCPCCGENLTDFVEIPSRQA